MTLADGRHCFRTLPMPGAHPLKPRSLSLFRSNQPQAPHPYEQDGHTRKHRDYAEKVRGGGRKKYGDK